MSGTTPASGRPAAGPVRPYSFPRFVQRLLSNGVQLIVAPMHALPIVTVHVLTDAGATQDPPGREGLAMLTAELLAEGTASVAGAVVRWSGTSSSPSSKSSTSLTTTPDVIASASGVHVGSPPL